MQTHRVPGIAIAAACALAAAACSSTSIPAPPTCVQTGCGAGQTCEVVGSGHACVDPIVVAGRVYDLGNSNASTNGISGAVVVGQDVNGAPMSPAGVSTTDGSYTFAVHPPRNSDGSPSGSVTLRVDADGYATFPSGLRVALPVSFASATHASGKWTLQNLLTDVGLAALPVSPHGAIRGTVHDVPADGALVVAQCGAEGYTAVPGVGGGYTIFNVPLVTCASVNAYAKGVNYVPAMSVSVSSSGVDLVRSTTATATVGGNVIFNAGTPWPYTSVLLVVDATYDTSTLRGLSPPGLRATHVSNGGWSIAGIPNGHYRVLAAFETDYLVRDTGGTGNTGVLEFQVVNGVPLQMDNTTSASSLGNFKITGAVALTAPLADPDGACTTLSQPGPWSAGTADPANVPAGACATADTTPTFAWGIYSAYSATDHFVVTVVSELGIVVWQANVDGAATSVDYGATSSPVLSTIVDGHGSLNPGTYQVRIQAIDNGGKVISNSEDLLGVFAIQ